MKTLLNGKCNYLIQTGAGPLFMIVAVARGPQEPTSLTYQVSMCNGALSEI